MNSAKKFIFLVQGEGRGHMTQAISLYHILTDAGHRVNYVYIGKSKRRQVPEYFIKEFSCPVELIESPNFITDKDNRKIRLIPSILHNLKYLGRYYKSLKKIHQEALEIRPDYLVNFYEFLGGFYYLLFRPPCRHIAVGHQFLSDHPSFPFAPGLPVDKWLFRMNNRFTSLKAYKKLALSFSEYSPRNVGNIIVCPPLLRRELRQVIPERGSFILAYMVNDGYARQIIDWHEQNRNVEVHCFWDRKDEPDEKSIHKNLIFHQLDAGKFLSMMSKCAGLATTAGFESVSEAMFLGKPVLMIPVEGQYEQACNALDAVSAGAGIIDNSFNLTRLLEFLPEYKSAEDRFKSWWNQGPAVILDDLLKS